MRRFFYGIAAALYLFGVPSLSDEGFFQLNSQAPAAVKSVAPYTVALWGDKGINDSRSFATAFLVKVKSQGKKNLGLFVTCAHVLNACGGNSSNCGLHLYHGYELVRGEIQVLGEGDAWSSDIKEIVTGSKDQEKWNQAHDLAAFTAEVPAMLNNPPAIRAWTSGEDRTVYAIGSPDTPLRPQWNVPPPPAFIQLLWSYGSTVIYEIVPYSKNNKQRVLFHVADLLPGNSGGPLFDSNGAIVGVNSKASSEGVNAKGKKEGFIYNSESDNIAIPAETLLQFLATVQF